MSAKRAWDWALAGLLVSIVLTAAARLASTGWTTHLYVGEAMGVLGACVGLALGASRWSARVTRWVGLGYTLTVVPWQLTVLSEQDAPLADKLAEIAQRIGAGLVTVYREQTLDDPILFITFAASTFWLMAQIGGFRLARKHESLPALLPAGLVILVVQIYDSEQPARLWMFALYLFLSLLLAGRVYYLENSKTWKEARVFQMPEAGRELARGLLLASALVVLTSWTLPLSLSSLKAAAEFWREFVRPLQPIKEDIALALDPLDSPYGSRGGKSDFYGETLALGRGLPLSDEVVFRVSAPDDLVNPPPRFYWRGRVFTTYDGASWSAPNPMRESFAALSADIPIPDMSMREIGTFTVRNGVEQSLIYSPGQIAWVNRAGEMLYNLLPNNERDLFSLLSETPLQPRETYRVRAALVNPSIEELRGASAEYPEWVVQTYLQLPANFSARIRELAGQIAQGQDTPYDKAVAVTQWLRAEIEYQAVIPAPPPNVDALEWALFEYKRGFCMYYASAEVLMLRSLGIPARMAVGFAQGELDEETNSYTVLRRDYHAWPE
ncbi:MAG: transglutaminaseTgpA domain-containing protein, partial [Chloroflexota bacterium]